MIGKRPKSAFLELSDNEDWTWEISLVHCASYDAEETADVRWWENVLGTSRTLVSTALDEKKKLNT